MFDIGFQEVVLIGLIGLVVVGPARLPKLAKTVGLYVNKMRRFVTDVRTDVERELHAEDLRQSLSGNGEFDELKNAMSEARAGLDDVRSTVDSTREELSEATSTPTDWSNPGLTSSSDAEPSPGDLSANSESTITDIADEAGSETSHDTSAHTGDIDENVTGLNSNFSLEASAKPRAPEAATELNDDEDKITVFTTERVAKREAGAKPD